MTDPHQMEGATAFVRPWVAYVGPFQFPWGQPGSRRVFGVARSILATGRDVVVLSGGDSPPDLTSLATDACGSRMSYAGMGELGEESAGAATKATRILLRAGSRTKAWLNKQSTLPSHVIVYGGSPTYIFHFQRWCKRNHIPLVVDVVEWYDPTHVAGGRFGPFSLSSAVGHRIAHRRVSGVIAISSYLTEFYRSRGLKTVRVPPTIEVRPLELPGPRIEENTPVRFLYFGTPGRKDSLGTIIAAVAMHEDSEPAIELLIVGPTRSEVIAYSTTGNLANNIRVLGRVDQDAVRDIVSSADFSVIIRESTRSSQAGFPTKFVESLAAGTPVVANATSDLSEYLNDGHNGFLVGDSSVGHVADALSKAARLSATERFRMKAEAHESATQFDWRESIDDLDAFLWSVSEDGFG